MSYFRTIHRSSVSARGVLTSTVPKCDMTGTDSFAFLRCEPDVELNSNFVFGLDARFSRRLDPEISLLHDGLAGVAAFLQCHVHRDRPRLPAQRQIPAQGPPPCAGRLRDCGLEYDLLMTLAIEYFRP